MTEDGRSRDELLGEVDHLRRRVVAYEELANRLKAELDCCVKSGTETEAFQRVLLELSKMDMSNYETALETLLVRDSHTLNVERVSYWSVGEAFASITCERLCILSDSLCQRSDHVLSGEHFPRYMRALQEQRSIVASDARSDPRTSEFTEIYLDPLGITSMLDVPVWSQGRLCGVLCHEHVGPRRPWTEAEREFAQSISEMIALTLEAFERKKAEQRWILAENIIAGSTESIVVTDADATIVDVNEAFCKASGFGREELVGRNARLLKSGVQGPEFYEEMWAQLVKEGQWRGEIWDRRKNGEVYPKLLSISAITDDRDKVTHYVGFSSDITEAKQAQERLQHLAHYDPLTGLANRLLFRDRLHRAIVDASRLHTAVALLMVDLDGFKTVNDTFGHPTGDRLLVVVAERLQVCVREGDTVSRLGGDEFAIVLAGLHDAREVPRVARRILEVIAEPFNIEGHELFVSNSIGITVSPSDGTDVDRLLQNADTALYRAKERGKNNFQFFSEDMNRDLQERADLERALRTALEREELQLHYQPIIGFHDGSVVAAEGLLRWDHPSLGSIGPGRMIAVAEESGLTVPIGEWVLRTACRQNRAWQTMGLPAVRVAVNVAGRQFADKGFYHKVVRILKETGLHPKFLELDLTESVAMRDTNATVETLRKLQELGVSICIDDFGTGYSSLNYLRLFPIDRLKIDQAFIRDLATSRDNQPILEAIIGVAHALGLKVVAEGIENKTQLGLLWALDCDEWQGFFFQKPICPDDFAELLRRGARGSSFAFQWTPDLSVHVDMLDHQHREWFRRAGELVKSVMKNRTEDDLTTFFAFLEEYARLHFVHEELLMQEHAFPGYQAQVRAHSDLLQRVQSIKALASVTQLSQEDVVEIVSELAEWFVHHIVEMDKPLGDFLRGNDPADRS